MPYFASNFNNHKLDMRVWNNILILLLDSTSNSREVKTWHVSGNMWAMVPNILNEHDFRVYTLKLAIVFLQFRNGEVLTCWLNKSEGTLLSHILSKKH